MESRFEAKFDNLNTRVNDRGRDSGRRDDHGRRTTDPKVLLERARNRPPDAHKHLNGGKGLRLKCCCWLRGRDCAHWSWKCCGLTEEQKERYRNANFEDMMGGCTKCIDRKGQCQIDFGFDTL